MQNPCDKPAKTGIIVNKQRRFLKLYYKIFFPVDEIVEWLSYGDIRIFQSREFAYTILGGAFKRYISFIDGEEMVKLFDEQTPTKVDICAVYNIRPKYSERMYLEPIHKELIFDIDLTDYDELRCCCRGTRVCQKCWVYIVIACKVLDASLREDWGFQHIFWVFSGRRGVHGWVCDAKVQWLNSFQRAAIADFLQVIKGSIFGKTRVHLNKMHVSIRRALKIIEPYFIPKIVVEQDMLGNEHKMDQFIQLLPTKMTKNEVKELFSNYTTSLDRWQAFLCYMETQMNSQRKVWLERRYFVQEIILRYCYPRLDVGVTTSLNHLLKLPFSVHPETTKIAVVLDVNKIDSFDLRKSPTLSSIWKEKMTYNSKHKTEDEPSNIIKNMKEYEKTSLKESVDVFKIFLTNLKNNYSSMLTEGMKSMSKDINSSFEH